MQVAPVNPRPFLQELTGKMVAVKLKWGLEYRGFLVATDAYMNLQVHSLLCYLQFCGSTLTPFDRAFTRFYHPSDGLTLCSETAPEH